MCLHGLLPTPFLLSYSVFVFFLNFFLIFRFWAVRWIKLAISSAFERTLIYRIVSYVTCEFYNNSSKFSCCYEHLKLRFYSSFNALYRRSKSSHSELVSVQLLQSFCLPVILYGLEVTEPQKSVLAMLNNLINRAVYKIFIKSLIRTLLAI